MDTSSGNPGPVSKRRRVGIACGPCRTRKSRCDGIRPKCSGCIELGYECIYTQTASMTNVIVGKEYLAGIEDRLKLVEQEISHMKNFRSNRHIRFDDATSSTSTALEGSPLTSFTDGVQVDSGNLQDNEVLESTTDGMGAMIFSQEEDIGFFGPSSNIAFTRQLSQVVTKLRNGNTGSDNSNLLSEAAHGVLSMSRPASPNAQATQYATGAVNIYAVPSEDVTRDLVRHYFGTTGQLFPYLDEKLFWDTYDEMRQSNFTKVRRTWLGLFNMILALSTSTYLRENITAITRVQESDVYYQRALGLCQAQLLQNSSLEAVQFLLVTGQYLQGTQKSVQAWSIHGLAVKTAFQLGLHSGATLKKFSLLDQEIRKRTWYGCVVLDRTLSMTFGRPATIPDEYVRLPLPTPMQPQIDIEGTVMHTSTMFFVQTIVLYKIMWDVIKLLYAGNIGCDETLPPVDVVSGIFKLEEQLNDWRRELPFHLSLQASQTLPPDDSDPNEKFRVILTLRYHNLRILLHRSMLTKLLDLVGKNEEGNSEPLLTQFAPNNIRCAVESSLETVFIVSDIVSSGKQKQEMLGAWWFTLYYSKL
ncbi:fungal-specific transcription factor domain-containing protein [Bisporella sp. PMI_857]|nr:fungal-specific transcription factor domain-containing protein [Bisporella sp. PMI_857]